VKQLRVLIVDDHPLVQDALASTLRSLEDQIEILFADSVSSALMILKLQAVDFVVLDLSLPDSVDVECITTLRRASPETSVVVCSGLTESHRVYRSLEAGACGYIPKGSTRDSLAGAFRTVLAGSVYLPKIDWFRHFEAKGVPNGLRSFDRLEDLDLSPRQLDVLRLIVRGAPNKVIGRELDIAEGTVKAHVSAVLAKLGARTRTEAVIAVSHLDLRPARTITGSTPSRARDENRPA
jgi:DNA-binding NarL/FixJ family response regulator